MEQAELGGFDPPQRCRRWHRRLVRVAFEQAAAERLAGDDLRLGEHDEGLVRRPVAVRPDLSLRVGGGGQHLCEEAEQRPEVLGKGRPAHYEPVLFEVRLEAATEAFDRLGQTDAVVVLGPGEKRPGKDRRRRGLRDLCGREGDNQPELH